jgi:putative ATPase
LRFDPSPTTADQFVPFGRFGPWRKPRSKKERVVATVAGSMPKGDDLFSAGAAARLAGQAPLATRMRPRSLDELVGQEQLVGPGKPLRALIEADRLSSCILWGPAGTGKTTIARILSEATAKAFEPMSAVAAGVKEVREVVERARARLGEQGQGTILFLDEIHRFNRAQQDALLPHVEQGIITLVGATTENPFFEVNGPLRSRSTLFRLEPLTADDLRRVVEGALADAERGLGGTGLAIEDEAAAHLAGRSDGDARAALNGLEVAAALAAEAGRSTITLADAETAINLRAVRYGQDEHYDVISAFIKSIRGSDPDAGLYWLARMLEAGEDARFIARRLVILASEDVGMADSMGLVVADAAARAVEFVGLPEAQLNLAHAVVYLATAPKSNRVTAALGAARKDAREGPTGEVPVHLRDASYYGAKGLGHGQGYRYPHDDPRGWVPQDYRPEEVAGRRYYDPSHHGAEAAVRESLRQREGGEWAQREGGE